MSGIIVFDIETLPNELDEITSKLLDHKVRNVVEEKKEQEMLQYRFHEPAYAKVCCIGALYDKGDGSEIKQKTFFSRDNEKEVIENFINYISQFTGKFVSFNGLDFDAPFILYKCCQYGIEPPQRFCNLVRFRVTPHFDLMQILTVWGKFRISLAEACYSFGITVKENLHGLDILTFLQQASDEDIQLYCQEDVQSTYMLYKKVSLIYQ